MSQSDKYLIKRFLFILLLLWIDFFTSCTKYERELKVETISVFEITTTSAKAQGNIVDLGESRITNYGHCWSTNPQPTINDLRSSLGSRSTIGSFTSGMYSLLPGTTYYTKAYLTSGNETVYGHQISFTTYYTNIGSLGSFTDSRDGKIYKTVQIGNQEWMAENLAYLPIVSDPISGSNTTPCYYVYGYNGINVTEAKSTFNYQTYGLLYNWPAATQACPPGWHLPRDAEWSEMENCLADNGYNYDGSIGGGRVKIAKSMASTNLWNNSLINGAAGNADYSEYRNKSGFSAIPGGIRFAFGEFSFIGNHGYWWCATEYDTNAAWSRLISFSASDVKRNYYDEQVGISVRCVRDK